jgi:hypothetical protein
VQPLTSLTSKNHQSNLIGGYGVGYGVVWGGVMGYWGWVLGD